MKKLLAIICIISLLAGVTACGSSDSGNQGGKDGALSISWWIPAGEDSSYYPTYDDNPCIKYIEQNLTFNGQKIDLTFLVPTSGAELDNFNTLLATDEYADILDLSRSKMSATELYEDDVLWDLTPYVEQYMPNYMKGLDANPDLKSYVLSDGKYLQIYGIRETAQSNFMGFLYRRDWVAKYGKNPKTGAAFTYGFGEAGNADTWTDDVVFPSGGTDPVYISDWEWMFEIFETAIEDLGITNGYCLAPYYKGYNEDGTLFSGFGGGAPLWSRTADDHAVFNGGSDNMRAYLQCMNAWYQKGWLDKNFAERTTDIVYSINSAGVHTGTVGMWIGRNSEVGAQLDDDTPYTKGIMVKGARQPINDVYGSDAQKGKEPDSMYQMSRLSQPIGVSKKITEEELPTVLAFLDNFFTEEGGILMALGMSKEQVEATDDNTYSRFGLTEAYSTEENGSEKSFHINPILLKDTALGNAVILNRLSTGFWSKRVVAAKEEAYEPFAQTAHGEWDYYTNTGFPDSQIRSQFTTDQSNNYNKIYANVDTFMSSQLPLFITGKLDINSDKDWNDYCKMLSKYSPDKVTEMYEGLFQK
ncbi:MAG: hypothetical protein IJL43_04815 [Lachnospiraceae bacterium]|nr:hypothetical protein [Lachnospiraceae bacterium]